MGRWMLVSLFLIIAIITAVVVFAVTGVIDAPALAWQAAHSIGWLEPYLETYEIGQDVEAWKNEQLIELNQVRDDLAQRELALAAWEKELEQKAQMLERQEAQLEAQRAQRMNVSHLAQIYSEMDELEAARILENMNDDDVLQILAVMETGTAARILEAVSTDKAASLSRKLGSF